MLSIKSLNNLFLGVLVLMIGLFPGTLSGVANASSLRPEGVPANYPAKEIEYIYAFSPGSINDVYIRMLGEKIQKMEGWKKGIIINYREGASGRIGWSTLAKAKPDGYSIGFAPSAMLISAVSENQPYSYDNLEFIANMMTDPGAIGVAADSEYKTLGDLVEAAKKNPGKISIGVTSTIGQEGLTMKLIEKQAGVKFNLIPFDGESAIFAGIIGKHIDGFCLNVGDTTNYVQEGQIKVLATGDTQRSNFLPDVPTYKESGFDVVQVNMRSIAAPKGTPEPIRKYLENCFLAASKDPEVQERASELKIPVDPRTGAEVKEAFATITATLQKLWKEEPWE